MSIRKQTLEEWFLAYQLKALQKNHVYNPIVLEADISKLESVYAERGERMPYTAVLIKALALAAEQHPCINRVFFSRPWGDCIVEPPTINVNFPHYITDEGREYLIASTVASANEKSVAEIKALIRESCQKKLAETIVAKHFKTNRNTLLKRLLLRLIHFVAYSFPKLYLTKGGGGLSVSSLLNHVEEGFRCTPVAWGPTAMTVSSASVVTEADGRRMMRLGLAWDHCTGEGNAMIAAVKTLAKILQCDEENALSALT